MAQPVSPPKFCKFMEEEKKERIDLYIYMLIWTRLCAHQLVRQALITKGTASGENDWEQQKVRDAASQATNKLRVTTTTEWLGAATHSWHHLCMECMGSFLCILPMMDGPTYNKLIGELIISLWCARKKNSCAPWIQVSLYLGSNVVAYRLPCQSSHPAPVGVNFEMHRIRLFGILTI
jgi:hypothetical protein